MYYRMRTNPWRTMIRWLPLLISQGLKRCMEIGLTMQVTSLMTTMSAISRLYHLVRRASVQLQRLYHILGIGKFT